MFLNNKIKENLGKIPQKNSGQALQLNSGQAVMIAIIFFLMISTVVILGIAFPVIKQAKVASDLSKSRESFYLAEAGLEDVIYRISEGYTVEASEDLTLDGNTVTTLVEDTASGKSLESEGDYQSYFRKIETDLLIAEGTSFHYGVQVGDGGLTMNNNSVVNGNVFSSGNITAANNARIFGTAIVGTPNRISGGRVSGDVYADTCTGGTNLLNIGSLHTYDDGNCNNYVSLDTDGLPILPLPLPIGDDEIDQWKSEAESGGIINGNYILTNGDSGSLGPTKVTGELIVDNGSTLTITGTVWVEGKITIKNDGFVSLDSGYGNLSGLVISDDLILLDNGSNSEGSGEEGSYIMYLSTSNSSQAIEVKNNANAAIVYTNNGTIKINNNAFLVEVVGYGVHLENNATITYELGLENVVFTSGPGGGYLMINWKEIE